MKNIRNISFFLVILLIATTINGQEKGFKTDATTGVEYHFIKHDKSGTKYAGSEYASIVMVWTGKNSRGDADSVYFDSRKVLGDSIGAISIPLKASFRGSLEDGIMMMTKGDSAVFRINADSLFLKSFHASPERIPHFITGSTIFTFNIKLIAFQSKDDAAADKQAQMKRRTAKMGARKGQEPKDIATYLQKSGLNIVPDADSIFYLQTTKGMGGHVEEGDSIQIKYRGTFLDGVAFDPAPGKGIEESSFKIVYSKSMGLIQGWIAILGKMNQGDKVRVLIPSKMAYGSRGMGQIQPYTPLIFDMELVSVKSNK